MAFIFRLGSIFWSTPKPPAENSDNSLSERTQLAASPIIAQSVNTGISHGYVSVEKDSLDSEVLESEQKARKSHAGDQDLSQIESEAAFAKAVKVKYWFGENLDIGYLNYKLAMPHPPALLDSLGIGLSASPSSQKKVSSKEVLSYASSVGRLTLPDVESSFPKEKINVNGISSIDFVINGTDFNIDLMQSEVAKTCQLFHKLLKELSCDQSELKEKFSNSSLLLLKLCDLSVLEPTVSAASRLIHNSLLGISLAKSCFPHKPRIMILTSGPLKPITLTYEACYNVSGNKASYLAKMLLQRTVIIDLDELASGVLKKAKVDEQIQFKDLW